MVYWFKPVDVLHVGNVYCEDTYDQVQYRDEAHIDRFRNDLTIKGRARVPLFVADLDQSLELGNGYFLFFGTTSQPFHCGFTV